MFTRQLLDHFENPRNTEPIESPTASVEVSNPICGDILKLSVLVDNGSIAKVSFRTRGCTASMAASSALTELLQGKTLQEAAQVGRAQVDEALGGLPNESKHVAVLAEDAVKALVKAVKP